MARLQEYTKLHYISGFRVINQNSWFVLTGYIQYEGANDRRFKQCCQQFFSARWWFEVGFESQPFPSAYIHLLHNLVLRWLLMPCWVYCSIPFSVDDLSKPLEQMDISDIEPPPLIRENSGFSFLLPRADWQLSTMGLVFSSLLS